MPGTKDRLLIVEDSPTQAEQLRWSLEQAQFSVRIASSAEEALEIFSPEAFDLVVSDIMMPGASGYELCKRIKSIRNGQDIPVVLLSARNDPMTIIRALECGADNFLTKPYEIRHLTSRIRTALSNRNLRSQGKFKLGVEVMFMGQRFAITSEKEQILDLLMSTFEDIVRANQELEVSQQTLASAQRDLERHARDLEQVVAEQTHTLRERQRQLKDAQTIASMGDWFCDAKSLSIRWSDQVYRLFGQDESTFTPNAENVIALLAPEDRDRGAAALTNALERKMPFQIEVRICREDGTDRICRVTGNPEIDQNGNVLGAFGVAQDVTEWRQMQAEVIETGDRYRQLFESTPDGVLVTTRGTINLANSAALKIFGVNEADELLDRNVYDFFDPDLRARVEKLAADLVEGRDTLDGGTAQCSGYLNRADGQSAAIELTCSASALSDPPSTHFIIRDVSRRVAMEEQLFQAHKMEAVGQLTGGISHDFNNLLSIIIGNLDVVKEQVVDPEVAEALDEALQAALRGAELNQRLLAFSRRQALSPKPTPVNELVFSTSRLLQRALGERIDLKLQLEADPDAAMVDAAQLEAAVTNLAVNARDAMPQGGELRIRTRRHREPASPGMSDSPRKPGDYVVVEVGDSGTGMEPEVQRRACDPFFTTKEEGKGTGLGLSMVHGFMEQSGGALQIVSKVNDGTIVSLFLPVASEGAASMRATTQQPDSGQGEVILVVEDNERLRRVLIKQLQALGYDTIEAGQAESAVEILRGGQRIDLLFTDLVMPGRMDGQELAQTATSLRPEIKVILTSGFSEALLDRPDTLSAPLLRKPYRREDLARVLRKALGG